MCHTFELIYVYKENKRKKVIMLFAVILVLIIMSGINKTLSSLEHRQKILCYDIHILSNKIREEEIAYLKY